MRVLIITADRFEDSELTEPLRRLQEHGVTVDVGAPHAGVITGKRGGRVEATLALEDVQPERYDLLVLPGGKAPAELQHDARAVAIARHFLEADKTVAAICHGPQVLIPSGLLAGRTATCYPGIASELEAAGVNYQDREVVVDRNLITSRRPADLPAFIRAIFEVLRLSP